ncbi:MAG: L-histidine N(alpha)-methyltransferase [Candidatus Eremiobacteraeota bacterium]|nr:L-histidine N(alpha)-methyltransferase [Candidatus Eremiobacteraeota bacterium]
MIVPQRNELMPVGERFSLYRAPERAQTAGFADDVRSGLTAERKTLAPKYFYDELGSALFEAITLLPEYYLTRTEGTLLERYAPEMIGALDGPIELVEFGSGSARKSRTLIAAALEAQARVTYHPIDISPSALIASASSLVGEFDRVDVAAYASDYVEVLASARLSTSKRVLALFLGSNVGNYEPSEARALLRAMSSAFKPGDGLLLGTDLKKDAATLELAYNDPTGVTAAFDKNVLGRINRELGGHFDLDAFEHVARYEALRGRIESRLIAQRGMIVPIEALDLDVRLFTAESIHTESSYKFDDDDVARLAADSGFSVARRWTDAGERFAVWLLLIS